jgi:uncharacterized protein (DUF1697 family)
MRYVALLRGINVGGNTMIKMEVLRRTFEGLGFKNVASYINSGNLAFDSRKASEASIVAKIEADIETHFGKPVQVMVREQKDIERVLANNPFEGQYANHKEMHVLFLKSELSEENKKWLSETAPSDERFLAAGREIYCHLPMGVADSYLGRGQFEKKLKVSMTGRNWRTVQKLAEL